MPRLAISTVQAAWPLPGTRITSCPVTCRMAVTMKQQQECYMELVNMFIVWKLKDVLASHGRCLAHASLPALSPADTNTTHNHNVKEVVDDIVVADMCWKNIV
jgi:hypothetical protein